MSRTLQADDFLDALAALLTMRVPVVPATTPATTTPIIEELSTANVCVWHHGETDPDEDVKRAAQACQGVSVLIYDLGGEANPDGPATAVIAHDAAVELYVDTRKRNRRKTGNTLRLAGAIRDDIMRQIHRAASLRGTQHSFFDTRLVRWQPLEDANYTAYRITCTRPISLE